VIDNGSLDFSVSVVDSSIKSLAGTNANANVFLGSHTLTLTAANDTYAGFISGTGGLTLASGTETPPSATAARPRSTAAPLSSTVRSHRRAGSR
jgi:hypothetical protein